MRKRFLTGVLTALTLAAGMAFSALAADASDVISDGVFIGDQDVSGMTAEEAKAYVKSEIEELSNSLITIQMGDAQISRTWGELGLKWTNTELIEEISQLGTTGNIVRRYKEQKDLQNQSSHYEIEYSLDEDAQEAFVNSMADYNSDPVEGSVYMGSDGQLYVDGGTDGLTLNAEKTLASLKEYVNDYQSGDIVLEASYDSVSPILTAETLSRMTDVLGSATTDYSSSSWGRATNVENGTAKINGTLLMPGESFSVTAAVAPFTAENGYELAPSYESGQVVDSYGGGICQVSTTLYNAVLKAELQIDSRSNHTMLVSYVDPSKDAAIAEGLMDLVFTNTLESPVYIAGSAWSGTLNFAIYGEETRPSNRSIEFVSETLSKTDPNSNIKLVAKTDQNVGYLQQVQSPKQGLSAVLWKNTYYDGVLSDTTQVNSSNYQATPAIYEVGIVTDNTALSSALNTAIAQNDLTQVQYLIANGVQTEAPQTEAPQTTAPQTEAAQNNDVQYDPPEETVVNPDGSITIVG